MVWNFLRGLKLWMGVIKNQDFGVTSEMLKDFWRYGIQSGGGKV